MKKDNYIFAIRLIMAGFFTGSIIIAQGHGHNYHNGRSHYEDWPDSLDTITVNGTVSIESIDLMQFYNLETNDDDSTDYILGFGPWWYEPESGAVRPTDGDVVTITGGVNNNIIPAMLVVFEIDGLAWRDSAGAPPWSGGWIHNNASDTSWVFCPIDSLDHVGFSPTGMNGMMGNMGTMWPDSIYCQFEEIHTDSLPVPFDQEMFEAYICNFNNDFGGHFNMMGQYNSQNMNQGMMDFNRSVDFQFHYDENVLSDGGFDENSISLFYLDEQGNWLKESDVIINFANNTISLNNTDVAEYYIIQANTNQVGTKDDNIANLPSNISIDSVYPNPFNPATKINYTVSQSANIKMQIYDINGNFVKEVVNEYRNPGKYSIQWDGKNNLGQSVSSGTYIVKISKNNFSNKTKITLLR